MFLMFTNFSSVPSTIYEPNWYLSTVVQATASIVAIMGGFLISRFISMSADKKALDMRMAEAGTRHMITEDQLRRDTRQIVGQTLVWFKEDALKDIVENPLLDIKGLVASHRYRGDDVEKTIKTAQDFQDRIVAQEAKINEHVSSVGKEPRSLEELEAIGINLKSPLNKEIAERILARRYRNSRSSIYGFGGLDPNIFPASLNRDGSLHEERISLRDELDKSRRYQEGELGGLFAQINILPSAVQLLHGLLILVYFGVVGILIPLYKMTNNPVVEHNSARIYTYWEFALGFAWLVTYLGYLVSKLLDRQKIMRSFRKSESEVVTVE